MRMRYLVASNIRDLHTGLVYGGISCIQYRSATHACMCRWPSSSERASKRLSERFLFVIVGTGVCRASGSGFSNTLKKSQGDWLFLCACCPCSCCITSVLVDLGHVHSDTGLFHSDIGRFHHQDTRSCLSLVSSMRT